MTKYRPGVRSPLFRHSAACLLLASAAATAIPAVAVAAGNGPSTATSAVPVSDFFRRPNVSEVVVSPSGRYVAAAMKGGPSGRQRLVLLDLRDLSLSRPLMAFSDADVATIHWVNDDRLVVSATDLQQPYGGQFGGGLFAVDREGRETPRELISRRNDFVTALSPVGRRVLEPDHSLMALVRDGSPDVLVVKRSNDGVGEFDHMSLLRLDTQTGQARSLSAGAPEHVLSWATDRQGVPRAAFAIHGGEGTLYGRSAPEAAWAVLQRFKLFDAQAAQAPWLLAALSGREFYATGLAAPGEDTTSLLHLEVQGGELKIEPLLSLKGFDFTGRLIRGSTGQLLGVQYLSDARSTHWFDPTLRSIQAQVDRLLPGTSNLLDCGECQSPTSVVVRAASDRLPAAWYLYDVTRQTIEPMFQSRPWIEPRRMAVRDMVRITARDGLSIPVHVTKASALALPAPMVVLVHGGPWVRGGEWVWEADTQFLASRGYVVVEPEFRGSLGFGNRLFAAGFKQWGLAMQDDIADAALWAVKQGYADPKRICIAGASYGGYATLMGLIRHPELYRCGVEWVGVTDIDLMYSNQWSDLSEQWKRYGMPSLVGDREKDAAQLAATSPIRQAARLKQPLVMAYGGEDRRVPLEHGQKMRDALEGINRNVTWIVYPDEGHGWMLEANDIDFWTRVESFLDKNLKSAP